MIKYPILEFDSTESIITPSSDFSNEFNEHLVICFFKDVIEHFENLGKISKVQNYKSELGEYHLYNLNYNWNKISVLLSPSGAPMAASLLEEAIACGVKYVISYGTCGVLDNIKNDRVFIPFSAMRDEGTSYHYVKPSKEIEINPRVVDVIVTSMESHNIKSYLTKTWSTDGVFRTTERKVKKMKEDGCLTVDMECSALTAVSKFRGVKFGQIFFSSKAEGKTSIEITKSEKLKNDLFWVAAESCSML